MTGFGSRTVYRAHFSHNARVNATALTQSNSQKTQKGPFTKIAASPFLIAQQFQDKAGFWCCGMTFAFNPWEEHIRRAEVETHCAQACT